MYKIEEHSFIHFSSLITDLFSLGKTLTHPHITTTQSPPPPTMHHAMHQPYIHPCMVRLVRHQIPNPTHTQPGVKGLQDTAASLPQA